MSASLRSLVSAIALATSPGLFAAGFTYHGDLMDGDAPASGEYDLRVRSFAQPGAAKALGEATELLGVKVAEGRFSAEFDLPEDVDGTTWIEVAVRKAGSADDYEVVGAPQPVSKVNSTCPGAWALDGNSGAPAGSYLGFADLRMVSLMSPAGVRVNSLTPLDGLIDFGISAKSAGDADVDFSMTTRAGKVYSQYVSESTGTVVHFGPGRFEFIDDLPNEVQNIGASVFAFSGRLRSKAVGEEPTDTSGGIWFDDERESASFVGRGDNQSNWTGFYEATGGWRFTVHDNGGFGFNTGTTAVLPNTVVVNASNGVGINSGSPLGTLDVRSTASATDAYIYLRTATKGARLRVNEATGEATLHALDGGLELRSSNSQPVYTTNGLGVNSRIPAANALEVQGNASKSSAGDWLANSDRRIKTGIAPIPNALDTIMKLRPVTFRYDAAYRAANKGLDEKRYYNVIAQEFAEVFPDAVKGSGEYLPGTAKTAANEILQVDTYPAQITALAAIQELAVADEALRAELALAQTENATLRRTLHALEARLQRLEATAE
jgi:hypothetical protein